MARLRCGDIVSGLPFCDQLPTEAEAVYRRHAASVPSPVCGDFGWVAEEGGVDSFVDYVCDVLGDQGRAEFSKQCVVLARRWRGGALDKLFASSSFPQDLCDTDDCQSDAMDTFSSFSIASSVTASQDEQSTCL
ncbi:hypothetical protein FGB62_139g226 [Gracilaria domingensis]|nr:hypothetical protein FGB62_139g226 [Gracilaria domingensis]